MDSRTLYLTIASVLRVFDISHATDPKGNTIPVDENAYASELIMWGYSFKKNCTFGPPLPQSFTWFTDVSNLQDQRGTVMSVITRNFPWFIKDPAVAIVGQHCYTSLIENLNVADVECLKYSLSKGLGIGIVVGGSIMKVPQLILIIRARSARGLSLSSYILETLAYAITTTYAARNGFPFSTYGENLFLTMQNVIITLLIIHHTPSASLTKRPNNTPKLFATLIASASTAYLLAIVPATMLAMLQMATIPLSLLSKFPQIYENQRAKSTGQLSAFAVISQVAGCLARLFTTATEVGDSIVFAGFLLALILNLIVVIQMIVFWDKELEDRFPAKMPLKEKSPLEGIMVPPHSPLPPQTQSTLPPGGKRWSRKLD